MDVVKKEIDYLAMGKRVAIKRRQLGLTQLQLCEMVDISDRHISSIECGTSKPSLQVMSDIAFALGTTLDHLVMGVPDNKMIYETNDTYQKFLNLSSEDSRFINIVMDALENR